MPRKSQLKTTVAVLRKIIGLSDKELAKLIDRSLSTVWQLESGRRQLTQDVAKKLQVETGFPLDWLLSGDPASVPAGHSKESFEHWAAMRKEYDHQSPRNMSQDLVEYYTQLRRIMATANDARENAMARYKIGRALDSLEKEFELPAVTEGLIPLIGDGVTGKDAAKSVRDKTRKRMLTEDYDFWKREAQEYRHLVAQSRNHDDDVNVKALLIDAARCIEEQRQNTEWMIQSIREFLYDEFVRLAPVIKTPVDGSKEAHMKRVALERKHSRQIDKACVVFGRVRCWENVPGTLTEIVAIRVWTAFEFADFLHRSPISFAWRHFVGLFGVSDLHPDQDGRDLMEAHTIIEWLLVDYWNFAGRDSWIATGKFVPCERISPKEERKREEEAYLGIKAEAERKQRRVPKWRQPGSKLRARPPV